MRGLARAEIFIPVSQTGVGNFIPVKRAKKNRVIANKFSAQAKT